MSGPQTLLQMAGVQARPHSLAETGLLIIDMQREYLDGRLALPAAAQAVDEAAHLLDAARSAARPIIHVRHKGRSGGLFDPDGPGFAIVDALSPRAGEPVIDKALPNAFAGTELAERLREAGINGLVVCGFMTHMCVSSTVRAAVDLGLSCTVVGAACATRDLPDSPGGVVPAEVIHRAELAALADRFAVVVDGAGAVTP